MTFNSEINLQVRGEKMTAAFFYRIPYVFVERYVHIFIFGADSVSYIYIVTTHLFNNCLCRVYINSSFKMDITMFNCDRVIYLVFFFFLVVRRLVLASTRSCDCFLILSLSGHSVSLPWSLSESSA